jgi:heme/copper-type cytochrome/quinol oxidase subunit 2
MTLSKFYTIAFTVAAITAAGACPDCALQSSGGLIETQTMTSKMAFSMSTLFMLGIVFSVIGLMVVFLVRYCRQYDRFREYQARHATQADV